MSLLTVPPDVARAEHIAYRLFLLKGYFYVLSEARPWQRGRFSVKWLTEYDGREWSIQRVRPQLLDLFRTVEHLRDIAPTHPIAVGQYYNWLTRRGRPPLDPKDVPQFPDIPGVPRWAFLLSRAARQIAEIPNWWLTRRMAPNGELGGFLGDDTDMLQWWVACAMLDSREFAPNAREAFQRIGRLVLKHRLRDGVNIHTTDALHAYEEGQNHMAVMPLLFYGDPQYVEWLMTSVRTVEKWMYRTPEGTLKFRVNDFGWKTAQNPPEQRAESVSSNAHLLMHPHLMLAWYNQHPHAVKTLCDYVDGFGGKILGGAYGGGASLNFACYWMTCDPKYLGMPKRDEKGSYGDVWQWAKRQPDFAVHGKEAREQPWWPEYVRRVAHSWQNGWWAWAVGQRRPVLCKALEFALYGNPGSRGGGAEKYRYIWTEAEQFTDRIFLPVEVVAQAMLGGYTARNKLWPGYAVSYEDLGRDFAALVLDQGKDRLKVVMINTQERRRTGAFRVWQLRHGRYELKVGPDANDDGIVDKVEKTRTLTLKRMDRVPVSLPPRRLMVYELGQREKLTSIAKLPDPAIGDRDVVHKGRTLKVTVHNIGSAPARDLVVALVDANARVLSAAKVASLDAPLDLRPRTATVVLDCQKGGAGVVLDPQNAIAEITELNNRVNLYGGAGRHRGPGRGGDLPRLPGSRMRRK